MVKTRTSIKGWRNKLENLVAEHDALVMDLGPGEALTPQNPKA